MSPYPLKPTDRLNTGVIFSKLQAVHEGNEISLRKAGLNRKKRARLIEQARIEKQARFNLDDRFACPSLETQLIVTTGRLVRPDGQEDGEEQADSHRVKTRKESGQFAQPSKRLFQFFNRNTLGTSHED